MKPLVLLSLLLTPISGALELQPGGVRPLAPFFQADGLSFQQTWVLQPNSSLDALRFLSIRSIARVAVELQPQLPLLDAPDALAAVVVYGDSPAVVELVEPQAEGQQLSLKVKNEDAQVQGLLFTQVYVKAAKQIERIMLGSSADVVVGDGVLAEAPKAVEIGNTASGDLGVKLAEDLVVDKLRVAAEGSGHVQVKTPGFRAASELDVSVSGSGAFKMYTREVDTPVIRVDVAGSGEFEIKNEDRAGGSCKREEINLQGSGSAKTGAVVCESVSVNIAGSGSAVIQASSELSVDVLGSGHVKYVNKLPPQVHVDGAFPQLRSKTLKHKSSKQYVYKDKYSFKTLKHRAQHVVVHVTSSTGDADPSVTVWSTDSIINMESLEVDPSSTPLFAGMTFSSASSMLMPSATAAVLAAVFAGFVVATRLRRRVGRGYHSIS